VTPQYYKITKSTQKKKKRGGEKGDDGLLPMEEREEKRGGFTLCGICCLPDYAQYSVLYGATREGGGVRETAEGKTNTAIR